MKVCNGRTRHIIAKCSGVQPLICFSCPPATHGPEGTRGVCDTQPSVASKYNLFPSLSEYVYPLDQPSRPKHLTNAPRHGLTFGSEKMELDGT